MDDLTDVEPRPRDEGSVLMLVLVMLLIGSLVMLPLMNYASSVLRANSVLSTKTRKVEAAKAGLRVALSDPVSLYEVCGQAGPTTAKPLAAPSLSNITVSTKCYFVDFASAHSSDELHYGLVSTQVGQTIPAQLKGSNFVNPNPTNSGTWLASVKNTPLTNTIFLPNLPVHGLNRRAPAGYQMPAGYPACTVFFPGTYVDPIVVNGPAYFASGIYYFQNTVTFNGGANAVIGMGAVEGCTSDQEAAFTAVNAPATHNINGLGATFVFGDYGRLVVDNSNNQPITVKFNERYVQPDDTGAAPSAGVSMMSVNGYYDGVTAGDLDVPNLLKVPLSVVGKDGTMVATAQEYIPSKLVVNNAGVPPTTTTTSSTTSTSSTTTLAVTTTTVAPAPSQPTPILDMNLTTSAATTFEMPGYLSVPQGRVRVNNPNGLGVRIAGGIVAASYDINDKRAGTPAQPQSVDVGFIQTIVQRTFRIVTTAGNVTSTAIVQVNQNGAYAVNSWEVQ